MTQRIKQFENYDPPPNLLVCARLMTQGILQFENDDTPPPPNLLVCARVMTQRIHLLISSQIPSLYLQLFFPIAN